MLDTLIEWTLELVTLMQRNAFLIYINLLVIGTNAIAAIVLSRFRRGGGGPPTTRGVTVQARHATLSHREAGVSRHTASFRANATDDGARRDKATADGPGRRRSEGFAEEEEEGDNADPADETLYAVASLSSLSSDFSGLHPHHHQQHHKKALDAEGNALMVGVGSGPGRKSRNVFPKRGGRGGGGGGGGGAGGAVSVPAVPARDGAGAGPEECGGVSCGGDEEPVVKLGQGHRGRSTFVRAGRNGLRSRRHVARGGGGVGAKAGGGAARSSFFKRTQLTKWTRARQRPASAASSSGEETRRRRGGRPHAYSQGGGRVSNASRDSSSPEGGGAGGGGRTWSDVSHHQLQESWSETSLATRQDSWIWFTTGHSPSLETFSSRQQKFQSEDPRVAQLALEIHRQERMNQAIRQEAQSLRKTLPHKSGKLDGDGDDEEEEEEEEIRNYLNAAVDRQSAGRASLLRRPLTQTRHVTCDVSPCTSVPVTWPPLHVARHRGKESNNTYVIYSPSKGPAAGKGTPQQRGADKRRRAVEGCTHFLPHHRIFLKDQKVWSSRDPNQTLASTDNPLGTSANRHPLGHLGPAGNPHAFLAGLTPPGHMAYRLAAGHQHQHHHGLGGKRRVVSETEANIESRRMSLIPLLKRSADGTYLTISLPVSEFNDVIPAGSERSPRPGGAGGIQRARSYDFLDQRIEEAQKQIGLEVAKTIHSLLFDTELSSSLSLPKANKRATKDESPSAPRQSHHSHPSHHHPPSSRAQEKKKSPKLHTPKSTEVTRSPTHKKAAAIGGGGGGAVVPPEGTTTGPAPSSTSPWPRLMHHLSMPPYRSRNNIFSKEYYLGRKMMRWGGGKADTSKHGPHNHSSRYRRTYSLSKRKARNQRASHSHSHWHSKFQPLGPRASPKGHHHHHHQKPQAVKQPCCQYMDWSTDPYWRKTLADRGGQWTDLDLDLDPNPTPAACCQDLGASSSCRGSDDLNLSCAYRGHGRSESRRGDDEAPPSRLPAASGESSVAGDSIGRTESHDLMGMGGPSSGSAGRSRRLNGSRGQYDLRVDSSSTSSMDLTRSREFLLRAVGGGRGAALAGLGLGMEGGRGAGAVGRAGGVVGVDPGLVEWPVRRVDAEPAEGVDLPVRRVCLEQSRVEWPIKQKVFGSSSGHSTLGGGGGGGGGKPAITLAQPASRDNDTESRQPLYESSTEQWYDDIPSSSAATSSDGLNPT